MFMIALINFTLHDLGKLNLRLHGLQLLQAMIYKRTRIEFANSGNILKKFIVFG